MYYEESIVIDRPLETVVERFSDLDARQYWQVGLVSSTLVSGEGLAPGTQRKLVFETGKRSMEMTETILENKLPVKLVALYETEGVKNTSVDQFETFDETRTRYTTFQTFEMASFPMKMLAIFFPSMFRKQTVSTLMAFKTHCERDEGA